MRSVTRRQFLERTTFSAAAVALAGARPAEAQAGMFISLPPWAVARNVGWPEQAAYCASKAGLAAFTRAAALDAAPYGVRVNCVCPAFTNTPLLQRWVEGAPDPDEALREASLTQPLGRVARPSEIAAAIAYLASDEAGFVTGVALPVDGGVTAR